MVKNKLQGLGGLVLTILIIVGIYWLASSISQTIINGGPDVTWDGEGEVTVSDKYTLTADVKGSRIDGRTSYDVTLVNWPNGGYITFDDCSLEISDSRTCIDSHGEEWEIKLTSAPEIPEGEADGWDSL